MSNRYWCEKCGEIEASPFAWPIDGRRYMHRAGCPGGRVIPIATLCSELTVIEESDLAPGMVVVAVEDWTFGHTALVSPDVVLHDDGMITAPLWCVLENATTDDVRYVAGEE